MSKASFCRRPPLMNVFGGLSRTTTLLVVIIFCIFFLPFLNKAFHIDDAEFIYISHLIGWNPLNTTPVDYAYDGRLLKNSLPPYEMSHPLLVPYVIKIVSALFGQHEVMLHLSFLLFPVIALVSMGILTHLLFPGSQGIETIVVLFLCSLPAFLVNSQNIMADVPTLAFILLSMACYVISMERNSTSLSYAGGISLCLAAFTSYQALFFTPLIFLYILMRRKLTIHSVVSLAIPLAALLVWFLLLYQTYDFFPLLKSRGSESSGGSAGLVRMGLGYEALIRKGISLFGFIGSSGLCLVPAYVILNRSGVKLLWILFPLCALSYAVTSPLSGYTVSGNVFLSLLVALGLLTLIIVTKEALLPANRDQNLAVRIFLLSWIFLVAAYSMLIFPWLAARHVLPIFPPIIMLMVSGLGWYQSKKRRIIISCALCLSVLFGLASAYSDYAFAETYRDVASEVKDLPSGNRVWYIGKWGMQYYMEKAGAWYLLAESNDPQIGDFIVIPEMPRFWLPSPQLQVRMDLYSRKTDVSGLPLRLFNRRSNAGFYSSAWGLLPFSISREPDEVFLVFRVNR